MTSVNLHIELLVLEGLPLGTHEAPLVQAAIEAELTRLFEAGEIGGGATRDSSLTLVKQGPIALTDDFTSLGHEVAHAIQQGIKTCTF